MTAAQDATGTVAIPSSPRVIPCEEQGPVNIPLEEVLDSSAQLRLNPDIENGDYFAVHLKNGSLVLRARGYVGYIPLNDRIVVQVRPRVPVRNLSRLIQLSGVPPTVLTTMRGYDTHGEWNDSLLDAYAGALLGHVETVISHGLLREYVRREEVSSFPRGRVLFSRTIQDLRPRGIRHAAHVAWFDRSADNGPNRCLKYAMWTLARRYIELQPKRRESRVLHRRLNALYATFESVALDHERRFLDDNLVRGTRSLPTLRAYYRDALTLARAVIDQRAVLIESAGGSVRLPSIVLNMNYVFEAYVRNVLRQHAETEGWSAAVLDGNDEGKKYLFNATPSPQATPDIVVRATDGTTPLVLEVKNVPVQAEFSDRNAINQAISYALSYRAKRVVLVHPRASWVQPIGLRLLGEVDDVAVYQYRLDLGAEDLPAEDAKFGEAVAQLLPAGLIRHLTPSASTEPHTLRS